MNVLAIVAMSSIVSFLLMGLDKSKAKKGEYRVPENVLFLVALAFGAIGGTAGMFLFHHKTKHWYFRYGFPALAVIQIALIFAYFWVSAFGK